MRLLLCGFLLLVMVGCADRARVVEPGVVEGGVAPGFTLADAHGGNISLSEVVKKGPVVVIFYLGYSCPRCVTHLRSIEDQMEDFKKVGLQVVAISPDTVAETRDSAKTYGDFSFPLLSDPKQEVARKYGLMFDATTMLHGVFVIDGNGVVRFLARSSHPYEDIEHLLWEGQRIYAEKK